MTQRKRKHRLNLKRRSDVRWPWKRIKDYEALNPGDLSIGSIQRITTCYSKYIEEVGQFIERGEPTTSDFYRDINLQCAKTVVAHPSKWTIIDGSVWNLLPHIQDEQP